MKNMQKNTRSKLPAPFDAVSEVALWNAGRDQRALPRKYKLMAASPFGFYRGTAHLFYSHLKRIGYPASPLAWICGDAHVENFGAYRGNNRLEYFDINDFDEACFGPLSADIIRLASAILLACEELSLEAKTQDHAAEQTLAAYFSALHAGKALWCERRTSVGAIKALFKQLKGRKRKNFLNARTVLSKNMRKISVDGERYLALDKTDEKPAALIKLFSEIPAPLPHYFDLRDIAYRIAGLGSLGLRRYGILVHGRGDPDRNAVFDLKAGAPSAASTLMPDRQPKWPTEANRIVAMQNRLQAIPAARLLAVRISRRDYVLRALQPTEDRLNLAALSKNRQKNSDTLVESFAQMGKMLAWAHLRGAARDGADGPDTMIKFAAKAELAEFLAAARQLKSLNDADYAAFKAAYAAKDEQLLMD